MGLKVSGFRRGFGVPKVLGLGWALKDLGLEAKENKDAQVLKPL